MLQSIVNHHMRMITFFLRHHTLLYAAVDPSGKRFKLGFRIFRVHHKRLRTDVEQLFIMSRNTPTV